MFKIFKRSKVAQWEYDVLINIFGNLPKQYEKILYQLKEGLLNRVIFGAANDPNYVGFTYFPSISLKFEDQKGRYYKLEGIKVFDNILNKYLNIEIHIAFGLILGYSIAETKTLKLDVHKIDVSKYKQVYFDNEDYDELSSKLTPSEKNALNPTEVYKVILNDKEYYHVKDLEDGDFVAIDQQKKVYKITHDPLEINILDTSIEDIFDRL